VTPGNVHRVSSWSDVVTLLRRVDAAGLLEPVDSITVQSRWAATSETATAMAARRILATQRELQLTAAGGCIEMLTLTLWHLRRSADVEVTSTRTGLDASAAGEPRTTRMTVSLRRTPAFEHRWDAMNADPVRPAD
jgi:hypothetical protein